MQLKEFLSISTEVDAFEVRPLGVLIQRYWEARRDGRPGLRQEDVEDDHIEFLLELFDYDPDADVYVHPAAEALFMAKSAPARCCERCPWASRARR